MCIFCEHRRTVKFVIAQAEAGALEILITEREGGHILFTQRNVHVQIAVQIAVERRTSAPVANQGPRILLHAVRESLTCMHPRKRACSNGFKFYEYMAKK